MGSVVVVSVFLLSRCCLLLCVVVDRLRRRRVLVYGLLVRCVFAFMLVGSVDLLRLTANVLSWLVVCVGLSILYPTAAVCVYVYAGWLHGVAARKIGGGGAFVVGCVRRRCFRRWLCASDFASAIVQLLVSVGRGARCAGGCDVLIDGFNGEVRGRLRCVMPVQRSGAKRY